MSVTPVHRDRTADEALRERARQVIFGGMCGHRSVNRRPEDDLQVDARAHRPAS